MTHNLNLEFEVIQVIKYIDILIDINLSLKNQNISLVKLLFICYLYCNWEYIKCDVNYKKENKLFYYFLNHIHNNIDKFVRSIEFIFKCVDILYINGELTKNQNNIVLNISLENYNKSNLDKRKIIIQDRILNSSDERLLIEVF